MVIVPSSTKGTVKVEIKGSLALRQFMIKKKRDIDGAADFGVFRAATLVSNEVQESIIGNRAETKSVDTGRFGNSITVDKLGKATFRVFPERSKYPGANATTQDVANLLEFGTSRLKPRKHFRNTEARTKKRVLQEIKRWVTLKV